MVLLGIAGLAVDGGALANERRHAQAVADAAALAAAAELYNHWPDNQGTDPGGTAKTAAQGLAADNGYANDGTTSVVTVNIPPQSGSFSGQKGYAEVIVQYNVNRSFSSVFGSGAIPVRARAVAMGKANPYSNAGILLLDPSSAGAYNDSGKGTVIANDGTVIVDSTSLLAVQLVGNALLKASTINLCGNYSLAGQAALNGTVNLDQPNTPDPLAKLPVPDPSSLTQQSTSTLSYSGGSYTLSPGVYEGGINLSSSTSVTLQPGVYYLKGGGLTISGQASLSGSGVMIYNDPGGTGGAINISGGGTITLSPPTAGVYKGLTFFQNRSASVASTFTGGSNINITGTFYFAGARANVSGGGFINLGSQYISDDLTITGNSTFNINYNAYNVAGKPGVNLVE
jgi:hypothetical protein